MTHLKQKGRWGGEWPCTTDSRNQGSWDPTAPHPPRPHHCCLQGQARPGRVRARTNLRPDAGTAGALGEPVLRLGPGVGAGAWPVRMPPRLGGWILGGSAGRDLGTTGGASRATGELCGLLPGSRWGELRPGPGGSPDFREHGGRSPTTARPGGSPGFRQVQGHPLQARLLGPGSPGRKALRPPESAAGPTGPGEAPTQ